MPDEVCVLHFAHTCVQSPGGGDDDDDDDEPPGILEAHQQVLSPGLLVMQA